MVLEGFDWQLFAIISYCFGLVLIIVLIILWGSRDVKSRYAKLLEEKETKLSRMQLDIEESMEALDTYATELRADWDRLRKKDEETVHRLHKRQIDLEATVSTLKARITALEIQARASPKQAETPVQAAIQPVLEAEVSAQEIPERPRARAQPAPPLKRAAHVKKGRAAKAVRPDNEGEEHDADIEDRARALLNDGHDDAQVAKKLGLSRGEIALMQKSLHKNPEVKRRDDRIQAQEMFEGGASVPEIARDMGLSVSEVALLIANPNPH